MIKRKIDFNYITIQIRILYEKFLVFISTGKKDYELTPLRENTSIAKNFNPEIDDEIIF